MFKLVCIHKGWKANEESRLAKEVRRPECRNPKETRIPKSETVSLAFFHLYPWHLMPRTFLQTFQSRPRENSRRYSQVANLILRISDFFRISVFGFRIS